MARAGRRKGTRGLDRTAESVGTALGHVAARVHSWKQQRAELASEIRKLLTSAHALLNDLGQEAEARSTALLGALQRRKGGRPKGYRMSEETKAKLRAAWRRRKAAGKAKAPPA